MKISIKKVWIIAFTIFIVLAFLNPSRREFAEYLGYSTDADGISGLSRKMNFIVFSIYQEDTNDYHAKYLAIFKNFFLIG